MDHRCCWPVHTRRRVCLGEIISKIRCTPLRRLCLLVLPVWHVGFLGRADVDGQRVRGVASRVCVAERRVYFVGDQAAANNVPRVWSTRRSSVFGTSCLPSLPRLVFLSVRDGVAGLEHDPVNSLVPATRPRPHHENRESIQRTVRP